MRQKTSTPRLSPGHATLVAAGVEGILPICHGDAWSPYFNDPEGNGVECSVDTPFRIAHRPSPITQRYAKGIDLDQSGEEIVSATRVLIDSEPEFRPMAEWREGFSKRLEHD